MEQEFKDRQAQLVLDAAAAQSNLVAGLNTGAVASSSGGGSIVVDRDKVGDFNSINVKPFEAPPSFQS